MDASGRAPVLLPRIAMQVHAAIGPQVPSGPQDLALQPLRGVAGLSLAGAIAPDEGAEDAR